MVGEAVWFRGSMDREVGAAESKGEMRMKDGRGRILGLVRGGGWKQKDGRRGETDRAKSKG